MSQHLEPDPWRSSVTAKLLFTGFLIFILLIPLAMVGNLVGERERRQAGVIEEISQTWGRPQILVGPLLAVPYRVFSQNGKESIQEKRHIAWFLPDDLQISARIEPEIRRRGIFEAVVYRLFLEVSGQFAPPDFSQWKIPAQDILWEEAVISIALSDTRGIREEPRLLWGEQASSFLAGANVGDHFHNGLHVRLPEQPHGPRDFSFKLELNGNESVQFVPVGKNTQVKLASSWPDPSFSGEFLPLERAVSNSGFDATWRISYLARNYPQQWRSQDNDFLGQLGQTAFGARLLIPVDFYQKSERAVKYGVLFLLLTFLGFFLFEIFSGPRIHLFQYLLVGAGLVLFFLLLLSLSEHLGFSWAYLLAAASVVGLIGGYAGKVLASTKRAGLLSLLLAILYAYLYVLLHLQDYALLLGSLGLFAILAGVMYLTRNVDWYAVNLSVKRE